MEPSIQQWIDEAFLSCFQTFGVRRLLDSRFIVPSTQFFPNVFHPTPDGVQSLMEDFCRWMKIDPHRISIAYYDAQSLAADLSELPPTSTADGSIEIWLEVDAITDPMRLAASMTRELGHALLVSVDPQMALHNCHEQQSELVAIYHGAGLFLANTALFHENWSDGQLSGTRIEKRSFMDMTMFGYAMALYAALRGEWQPPWSRQLRPDVRGALRQSLRFLQSNTDHPVLNRSSW